MERRHQVFISSTFSDLRSERAEIIQALLELDCIPAGMEMFPATNAGAWELIKRVIDDSDYYCLVVGGRYGSVDEEGLGFTEKEYAYAVKIGKPLMAFLHKDPSKIEAGRTETSDEGRKKLAEFRAKVELNHHCKYWSSPEELGGQVSRGLAYLRKIHEAEGWVPGRYAVDDSIRIELANANLKISQLEAELARKSEMKSVSVFPENELQGGQDLYAATIVLNIDADPETEVVSVTWDRILSYVGPSLMAECDQEQLKERIRLCLYHAAQTQITESGLEKISQLVIPHVVMDQIIIQLRALGYMAAGKKRRAVSDRKVYWVLTEEGEQRLVSATALRRSTTGSVSVEPVVEVEAPEDSEL
ncbi:hypothetical protein GGR74_004094 [Xanthomonas arboricola]